MIFNENRTFFLLIFSFFLTARYLLPTTSVSAQMTEQQIQEQEAKWRAELAATEKEIAEWENILKQTKQGTASL